VVLKLFTPFTALLLSGPRWSNPQGEERVVTFFSIVLPEISLTEGLSLPSPLNFLLPFSFPRGLSTLPASFQLI